MHAKRHKRMKSAGNRLPNATAGASVSCPCLSSVGTARRRANHLGALALALLFALLAGAGCRHLEERETEFFAGAEQGIEDARHYAATRLKNLSGPDLLAIATTRPGISHVDYARVHYRWTNICTVLATAPPCRSYMVMDQRRVH
jgi:hypothetical protein